MKEIDLQEHAYYTDGVIARSMFIPKDCAVGKHKHDYSHLSVLMSGKVKIFNHTDKTEKIYEGNAVINIPSGKVHSIYAFEDSEWLCIHARTDVEKEDKSPLKLVGGV